MYNLNYTLTFWECNVQEKLHLGVLEPERFNTASLNFVWVYFDKYLLDL
jgi:hypothetical protein